MSSIQISAQEIQQAASQLTSQQQAMAAVFQEIQTKMNYVQSIWNSPASNALMNEFQSLHAVFETYTQTIQNYAQYLNNTSQTYEENEFNLEKAIQS